MSRKISIIGAGMDGECTLTAQGLEAVKNATADELAEVKGVSVKDAKSIYSYFHQTEE